MKIAVIQGPNLNMLGTREQNIYGGMKLEQIHKQMRDVATQNGFETEFFKVISKVKLLIKFKNVLEMQMEL